MIKAVALRSSSTVNSLFVPNIKSFILSILNVLNTHQQFLFQSTRTKQQFFWKETKSSKQTKESRLKTPHLHRSSTFTFTLCTQDDLGGSVFSHYLIIQSFSRRFFICLCSNISLRWFPVSTRGRQSFKWLSPFNMCIQQGCRIIIPAHYAQWMSFYSLGYYSRCRLK